MSTPAPFKVMIVEDHPDFMEALCTALAQCPSLQVMEPCKDLPMAAQLLAKTRPDVLLIDLGLPSGSGLGLIRQAQRTWGKCCTSAVLTVTGNEEHLLKAISCGAKGYLLKSASPQEWGSAVIALAKGLSNVETGLARRLMEALPTTMQSRCVQSTEQMMAVLKYLDTGYTSDEVGTRLGIDLHTVGRLCRQAYDLLSEQLPVLSPREHELLVLLDKGLSYKDCARTMGVAETTLKTLAKRAFDKLDATSLREALFEARSAGLFA
jgi:DNA-binding NarL/FixJ family response regulator